MKLISTRFSRILLFVLLLSSFNITASYAQLVAGDIAFTGYIAAGSNDAFSFVVMKTIPSGTAIRFTDNGFFASTANLNTTEGTITWTTNGIVGRGTEVLIELQPALRVTIGGSTAAPAGSLATVAGTFSLSTGGDQVIAYIPGTPNTYIGAFNMSPTGNDAAWDGAGAAGTNQSSIPTGMTNGVNCLRPGTIASGNLNARFNNCGGAVSFAAFQSLVFAVANWTGNSSNPQPITGFLPPCNFLTLASDDITLAARNRNSNVLVEWRSEQANAFFTVERSYNGRDFAAIGTVGENNTYNYNFTDADAVNAGQPAAFYRIKSTDKLSNKTRYSDIVKVTLSSKQSFVITNLSNPVKNAVAFNIFSAKNQDAEIIITDVNGRVALKRTQPLVTGYDTRVSFGNGVLTLPGVYFLTVITSEKRETIKLIKE
jgi:hypothetical protein